MRILLACLESHANRYKRYIVPLLSVHMDFYIRVSVVLQCYRCLWGPIRCRVLWWVWVGAGLAHATLWHYTSCLPASA